MTDCFQARPLDTPLQPGRLRDDGLRCRYGEPRPSLGEGGNSRPPLQATTGPSNIALHPTLAGSRTG
jgi:hypothetical protein